VTSVTTGENGVIVAAEIIAEAFGLAPSQVQGLMQSAAITSRFEKGEGEDAGRSRLTFYHNGRAFRLTVDDNNQIISRAKFDTLRQAGKPRP